MKRFRNHTYNKYENYSSGYESVMEMPKKQVAQAFALPIFIVGACGYFISKYGRKPKRNECWSPNEEIPMDYFQIHESNN